MTDVRVFYSEAQKAVLIEGARSFLPGNGALVASVDPLNANRVIVSYTDLVDQAGNTRQELGPLEFGFIRRADGSPAGANVAATIDYLNGEFAKGFDYQFFDSPALAQTTANFAGNPQTKFITTLPLIGGTYEVELSFTAWTNSNNRSVVVDLEVDGVSFTPQPYSKENKDALDRPWVTRKAILPLTPGDHDFEMLYGRQGGGGPQLVNVEAVLLTVQRVGS